MICNKCQSPIAKDAATCDVCGAAQPIRESSSSAGRRGKGCGTIISLIGCLGVVLAVFLMFVVADVVNESTQSLMYSGVGLLVAAISVVILFVGFIVLIVEAVRENKEEK
jgi:uncharacterized protein YqhQ